MKLQRRPDRPVETGRITATGTANAYDAAAADYLAYADGDPAEPFGFDNCYGGADREIWRRIDAKLIALAASGTRSLAVLDAGCGPATWLRRIALRAHALGFAAMQVRGLDISPKMVALAQRVVAVDEVGDDLCMDARIAVGDLGERLPFPDASFDITLCLYGVLNHMSGAARASLAAELSRVTRDTLFVTVRTAGSLPTIYVDALKRARSYHQDNDADWMEVEMADGRRLAFQSHLFTSRELRAAFAPLLTSVSMVGLDLFRSRFAHDPHWNPVRIAGQEAFDECIASLERRFASDPCLIDHAAHILLVGECGGARPQWPG